jgi:hypothetical protein
VLAPTVRLAPSRVSQRLRPALPDDTDNESRDGNKIHGPSDLSRPVQPNSRPVRSGGQTDKVGPGQKTGQTGTGLG